MGLFGRKKQDDPDVDALTAISMSDGFKPPEGIAYRSVHSEPGASPRAEQQGAAHATAPHAEQPRGRIEQAVIARSAAKRTVDGDPEAVARIGRIIGRVVAGTFALFMLLIVGGVGLAIYQAVDSATDTVDNVNRQIERVFGGDGQGTPGGGIDEDDEGSAIKERPQARTPSTLLAPAAFSRALVDAAGGNRGLKILTLRVDAERLIATFVNRRGRLTSASVDRQGQAFRSGSPTAIPAIAARGAVSQRSIPKSLPSRLAARAKARTGRKVNYLFFNAVVPASAWSIFVNGGGFFQADLRGGDFRRGGTPPRSA